MAIRKNLRNWLLRHPQINPYTVGNVGLLRLLSSTSRVFPNFLVIGAMKAGSTTLHQYINRMQLRLLSSYVLSTLIYYQHGIRQLYISYMTDDILTGEPPSWSTICTSQLQLKPSDVDTCMCALRVTHDLVPHREFQSILMTLSPVSGCLLFSQFIDLESS